MVKVLDASALLAYSEKEAGYEKVQELFVKAAESGRNLLMTTVNWGEVCYILFRDHTEKADEAIRFISTLPIDLVDVNKDIARQAALYKATKKLPYVDCFAAALTKLKKGELVTADKEFKVIEGDIKILWV